jgi:hypothetical protein
VRALDDLMNVIAQLRPNFSHLALNVVSLSGRTLVISLAHVAPFFLAHSLRFFIAFALRLMKQPYEV